MLHYERLQRTNINRQARIQYFGLHIPDLGERTINCRGIGSQSWSKLSQTLIGGALSFVIVKPRVATIEFDEPDEKLFTSKLATEVVILM